MESKISHSSDSGKSTLVQDKDEYREAIKK